MSLPTCGGAPNRDTLKSADSPSSRLVSAGGSRRARRVKAWKFTVTTVWVVAPRATAPPPGPTMGAPKVTVRVPLPLLRSVRWVRRRMTPPSAPGGMTSMPPPESVYSGATSPPTATVYGMRTSAKLAGDSGNCNSTVAPSSMAMAASAKAMLAVAAAEMVNSTLLPEEKVTAPGGSAVTSTAKVSSGSAPSSATLSATISKMLLLSCALMKTEPARSV